MSFTNYKQYDSRWGSKNYNGSSTMASAGCGATACAIIISGRNPKITPLDTMKYMQTNGDEKHAKFALYGQGTAWNGIPSCLRYYGCEDVQEVNVNTSMTKVWELMKKGYVGVFLFNGLPWTTQGHYVAVTDYKYEYGKHYVYTRDSGGRNRTGWYAYETTMKGVVFKVWLCLLEDIKTVPKPKDKFSGTIPEPTLKKGSKGTAVANLQKFLNWYCGSNLNLDGDFGARTETFLKIFQKSEGLSYDGIYGNASYTRALSYSNQTVNGRILIAELKPETSLEIMTSMVGQSLAIVNATRRAVFYATRDGSAQKVKLYDDKDKTSEIADFTSLGHCNGATLKGTQFYVCSYLGSKNTKKITVINANTLKRVKYFNLPVAVSGIAWDNKKSTLIGSKGKTVYIFDSNNNVKKKFTLRFADGTPQDIMAHNGYVYVCRSYVRGSVSCIDKYQFDGQYVGSYTINADELESCDIDESGYIHYITWNQARLIKTKTKVR